MINPFLIGGLALLFLLGSKKRKPATEEAVFTEDDLNNEGSDPKPLPSRKGASSKYLEAKAVKESKRGIQPGSAVDNALRRSAGEAIKAALLQSSDSTASAGAEALDEYEENGGRNPNVIQVIQDLIELDFSYPRYEKKELKEIISERSPMTSAAELAEAYRLLERWDIYDQLILFLTK